MRDEIIYAEIYKMQNGDFSGYETFYAETAPYIYALICDVIKDLNQAEQIMQEVYQEIYARIGEITQMQIFQSWMYKIATDHICQAERQEREFQLMDDDAAAYQIIEEEDTQMVTIPENIFRDIQGQKYIKDTLEGCTELQKLLVQYCTENVSLEEISYKTGLNEQQIKKELNDVYHFLDQVLQTVKKTEEEPVYQMNFIPFLGMIFQNLVAVSNGETRTIAGVSVAGASVITGGAYAGAIETATGAASMVGVTGASGTGMSAAAGVGASMAGTVGTSAATLTGAAASAAGTGTAVALGIGTKIAIGIASAALVAGGTFGIHKLVTGNHDKQSATQVETSTDAIAENAVAENATPEDAVEEAEEEIYTDPVYDGYYFTLMKNAGTVGTLDYDLTYLNYVGDDKQPIKDAFETWQNEKMNTFFSRTNDYQGYTAIDGGNTEMSGTISYERADSKILCIIYSEYSYLGGVHGYDYSDGVNFDVTAGKVLTVNDLGEAKESLKEMTLQKIGEKNSKNLNPDWQTTVESAFADNSLDFRMNYDGIHVIFDAYELAPYAMGVVSVTIPYGDITGLNPDYLPEDGIACLDIGTKSQYYDGSIQYDIDQDGQPETIYFWEDENEDSGSGRYYLNVDGVNIGEGFQKMHTMQGKLIVLPKGQKYIVVEIYQGGGSQYSDYVVYAVNETGMPEEVQRFVDLKDMYIDPYCVVRSSEIHVFGNYIGTKLFSLSSEGLKSEYHYYILEQENDELSLTAKQDVACKYEKDGKLIDGSVNAGTVIHPTQCDIDNHEFLFELEDGTKGRILYEQDETGVSVNGVPASEIF